jgi:broad specificity phosphatase PhoE
LIIGGNELEQGKLTIYFVRHGKTEWNLTGQMQGWGDSPLVSEGKNGAILVGEALQDIRFKAAYVSPSKRTQDTAKYILSGKKVPIHLTEEFREMSFGSWEGVRVSELDEQFKEARHAMLHSPATFDARENGGETYYQLEERVQKGIQKLISEQKSGNVLVVSHGMTLTLLMYLLGGGKMADHRLKGERILNTSISQVDYENGEFHVVKLNDIAHLEKTRV